MDDGSELYGLPPEEIVARLLEKRPNGYAIDYKYVYGPRRWWWPFGRRRPETRAEAWRQYISRHDREGDAKG